MRIASTERIERIVAAARKQLPQVAAKTEHECTDGQWRGTFNMHGGHKTTGATRVAGYCYQDSDGTRYGAHYATREDAERFASERRDNADAEFRTALEGMSPARLDAQEAFWIKAGAQCA